MPTRYCLLTCMLRVTSKWTHIQGEGTGCGYINGIMWLLVVNNQQIMVHNPIHPTWLTYCKPFLNREAEYTLYPANACNLKCTNWFSYARKFIPVIHSNCKMKFIYILHLLRSHFVDTALRLIIYVYSYTIIKGNHSPSVFQKRKLRCHTMKDI